MSTSEPLLLTERVDLEPPSAEFKGTGLGWVCFDLLVFAGVILFFS